MPNKDVLARRGGGNYKKPEEFLGEVITLVDHKLEEVHIRPGVVSTSVQFTILTPDGDEAIMSTFANGIVDKAPDLEYPVDVKIISGPGQAGNPWYDIADPEAEDE